MPCDGIAVAVVKVALPEVKWELEKPEAVAAVADLLQRQGFKAEARGGSLAVDRYILRYAGGRVIGYAPASVVERVREAYEQVGAVLAQERLADIIARQAQVEGRAWFQGHLVLQVNL